ncbi:alpha-amylase family glycosyl hydrolase [Carboxylicivirga linearis]|uniref:Glycosyl hydrolase family 13 catalytic domain-containing protein n=1 Tax=Carboxylicivirga linearis TaxID=1628157 RepID=A0ABS5JVY4_9BACT|nr:alpha-amylase family glycosyl hydrolase [Carboxylicivirga linearis]MBS2098945.1 hypothetical protein [Carboxylicivirga linearis]
MLSSLMHSQVILQGFYWDVPVNSEAKEGIWYNNLDSKLTYLEQIGITGIWSPPPSKGNWGIYDMGYGVYDHYDLGDIDQIGTISTRFGTRKDLDRLIEHAHKKGIEVYADAVLNHLYSFQLKDLEENPVLKNYLLTRSKKTVGYPVNELRFAVDLKPNQGIVIKLKNTVNSKLRSGFRLKVSDDPSMNNASQLFHPILTKNNPYGFWEGVVSKDVEIQYRINRNSKMKLWFQLEVLEEDMEWGDQTNGLTISSIIDEAGNELNWEVYSYTGIKPMSGKVNWTYGDFHPSSEDDYLVNYPDTGGIVANSKLFGHDFDHQSKNVQRQLTEWGQWLLEEVRYDGFRLDFVNGIEVQFIKDWTNKVIPDSAFCVTEFFTNSVHQIADWNKAINSGNIAKVKSFDFPLKKVLTDMCNDTLGMFEMQQLLNAGLISHLPADRIVTFAENHDTGKEHDKWITKDWSMAYSYILFHQPKPCIFYSHLFPTVQTDFHTKKHTVKANDNLPDVIEGLLKVRSILDGEVITDSSLIDKEKYVVFRKGVEQYNGAVLIIANPISQENPINLARFFNCEEQKCFINVLNPNEKVWVDNQELSINIAERGASVWMPLNDYEKLFKIER